MQTTYYYLALCGVLTAVLWVPYILARLMTWGLPTFLNNYPEQFPKAIPEQPLWAERAQRVHLNMVETMPALLAVVFAAVMLVQPSGYETLNMWMQIFFFARLAHAVVYIAGIPFLRTPVYLVSWFAILSIGMLSIA